MIDVPERTPAVDIQDLPLKEWRCAKCGRMLAKVRLGAGSQVEIKCHSCNHFSVRETVVPDRT